MALYCGFSRLLILSISNSVEFCYSHVTNNSKRILLFYCLKIAVCNCVFVFLLLAFLTPLQLHTTTHLPHMRKLPPASDKDNRFHFPLTFIRSSHSTTNYNKTAAVPNNNILTMSSTTKCSHIGTLCPSCL